ncbi:hypothetical protein PVL29_007621 [Vitis rotundifolia]|uniref:Uncharacterized protein n=1 Tax=Vitis rotundifolia TaxID=103349 RepID=A0AA39A159_VITRO|nr:hypothetical protein PVL29_007621 [Vitis rotundifolia]
MEHQAVIPTTTREKGAILTITPPSYSREISPPSIGNLHSYGASISKKNLILRSVSLINPLLFHLRYSTSAMIITSKGQIPINLTSCSDMQADDSLTSRFPVGLGYVPT